MFVSCGENMREIEDGRTMGIPLLIYGKILSHRAGTHPNWGRRITKNGAVYQNIGHFGLVRDPVPEE